ncbi:toll/interleukin-1 receptor domain-containing protein [Kriegella aquimaris]|uniref:TIR domain-containing protein n=1 Tax=Kriegella aquimaris TaxID=192904 RepID=A0A1G9LIE6_9FLAO|nr:toll/interleukin-1 receptor domain-containing protein [Kriegella aquimaris]SDL61295.1 TIR domain-containing protein [Kriegella aquimaris]
MQKGSEVPSIYVSYAWNPESDAIVDVIEKEFQKRNIHILRDKNDLQYKGKIKAFMERLGEGNCVILVVSNKYLRSENCMFELLQIFKNKNFYERIFPLVLDEVKIAKASDRIDLVKYWEYETENLDIKIRELKDLSNIQGVTDDLNLYTEIRHNIARLTNILKDINTLNTNRHINSDFEQLYSLVRQKIDKDLISNEELTINKDNSKSHENHNDGKSNILVRISTKIFGTTTFLEFFKKNQNGTIKFGITAIIGALALFLLVPQFFALKNDPLGNKAPSPSVIETEDSTVLVEKDTVANTNSQKEEMAGAAPDVRYTVDLVVPSNMVNAAVFVDGKPADVVERNLLFIKISIKQKKGSHHFEIKGETDSCITDKLISKDNVQLILCD